MLIQDAAADAEFRALLLRVVPVALLLFGLGALTLMFFIRGFRREDSKTKTNLYARLILLCATLLLLGLVIVSLDKFM